MGQSVLAMETGFSVIRERLSLLNLFCVSLWLSGNTLVMINIVAVLQTWLIPVYLMICQQVLPWYVTSYGNRDHMSPYGHSLAREKTLLIMPLLATGGGLFSGSL